MIKYILAFIVILVLAVGLGTTTGKLEGYKIKYSILLKAACSDKERLADILQSESPNERFVEIAGEGKWEEAKKNILDECDNNKNEA